MLLLYCRESIETFCKELQSPVLPLFIKCPNAREDMGKSFNSHVSTAIRCCCRFKGINRDSYVPRPSSTRPLFLQMYEFLGKQMGLAIRTQKSVVVSLPFFLQSQSLTVEIAQFAAAESAVDCVEAAGE